MADAKTPNGATNGAHPNALQAIRYSRGSLQLLDQRKLPHESIYIDIPDSNAAWEAIRDMVVRGAPAIAISAALALAVELTHSKFEDSKSVNDFIHERLDYLVSSRPTAVNLSDAAGKLKEVSQKIFLQGGDKDAIIHAVVSAAEIILEDDVASNKAIGNFGSESVLKIVKDIQGKDENINVLTHCNTGSLATAAYGTALGVVRSLFYSKKLSHCYCTETRPYNQGSRLTAFELVHDKIPATLIADSAAAYLFSTGRVDAVIVGADRITANGDTANKIGTYSLAILANHHNIPFFVAAPITTIDLNLESGNKIVIEERDHKELTHTHGGRGDRVAAANINVWNPSFDVTPAHLITGIITEKGVALRNPDSNAFDLPSFLDSPSLITKVEGFKKQKTAGLEARKFYPLNESSLGKYLTENEKLSKILGGSSSDWKIREVGDGNINFVYIVEGPQGSLVVKQALPYIRCVGESWPMTLERAYFEYSFLHHSHSLSPDNVPEVYLFDHSMAAISMRYLAPPHIILRKGLIARKYYPLLSRHAADYMAKTLFATSLIALTTDKHRALISKYSENVEMCRLTEQVIFTEPYDPNASNNRWTKPYLDEDAHSIQSDDDLKIAIASLKAKFCERSQALIHGDLHTGSIMVTEDSTQIIDPEFAFVGPIGFDVGALLANIFLSYFSQDGHPEPTEPSVEEYKSWLLNVAIEIWNLFSQNFLNLWNDSAKTSTGDAYNKNVYNSPKLFSAIQTAYLKELLADSLGFAGAKIIRRIIGIAHVEDLESIADPQAKAVCERKSLNFGKQLVKQSHSFPDIESVVRLAKSI